MQRNLSQKSIYHLSLLSVSKRTHTQSNTLLSLTLCMCVCVSLSLSLSLSLSVSLSLSLSTRKSYIGYCWDLCNVGVEEVLGERAQA